MGDWFAGALVRNWSRRRAPPNSRIPQAPPTGCDPTEGPRRRLVELEASPRTAVDITQWLKSVNQYGCCAAAVDRGRSGER